jgi:hypothetical protein
MELGRVVRDGAELAAPAADGLARLAPARASRAARGPAVEERAARGHGHGCHPGSVPKRSTLAWQVLEHTGTSSVLSGGRALRARVPLSKCIPHPAHVEDAASVAAITILASTVGRSGAGARSSWVCSASWTPRGL